MLKSGVHTLFPNILHRGLYCTRERSASRPRDVIISLKSSLQQRIEIKTPEPGTSQWYTVTAQWEKTKFHKITLKYIWGFGVYLFVSLGFFSLCRWSNTGTDFCDKLKSLHSWKYSKHNWIPPWEICTSGSSTERWGYAIDLHNCLTSSTILILWVPVL